MKRYISVLIIIIILLCGCGDKYKKFREIGTGYNDLNWAMTKDQILEKYDLPKYAYKGNKIETVERSLDGPMGTLGFSLMNPPSLTFEFNDDDVLTKIKIEVEDKRINADLFDKVKQAFVSQYGEPDYMNENDGAGSDVVRIVYASWDLDDNGTDLDLVWSTFIGYEGTELGNLTPPSISIEYGNDLIK